MSFIAFAGSKTWRHCETLEEANAWLSGVGGGRVFADAERLAAAEAAMIRYGSHMDNCRSRYPYTNVTRIHECDCGWEELKRAAKGGRDEI